MALSAAQIEAKLGNDIVIEKVRVPEWATAGDDVVYVKSLTGSERDEYESSLTKRIQNADRSFTVVPNTQNANARLAVLAVCDESGKRLWNDGFAATLGNANAAAVQRVVKVAMKLSGMTDEAESDAEGKFSTAETEITGSGSGSSATSGE